jgi:hypothetical protein
MRAATDCPSRKCDGMFLTLAAHCPDGRPTSLGSSCCIWILDNHIEHHRLVRWWSGWGSGVGGTGEEVTKGAPALVVRAPPRREYRPVEYNRPPVFACYLQARSPAEPAYGLSAAARAHGRKAEAAPFWAASAPSDGRFCARSRCVRARTASRCRRAAGRSAAAGRP